MRVRSHFGHRVAALAALVLAVWLMTVPRAAADSADDAWAALAKGGHVALIRHGNAPPGQGGDPPGFKFDDCSTQRNLDDAGREQARALGEVFRKHGVQVDRILASPMCRCLETGRLMTVGTVETSWDLLPDTGSSTSRLEALERMITSWRGPGTLVLVTHGFTVGRLAGVMLEQAETLVVNPTAAKRSRAVGRIAPPK